jgi:hypothetical protein
MDHQHVPVLRRPEEARKLALGPHVDAGLAQAVLPQQPVDQFGETIHLFAARDGAATTMVHPVSLLLRLRFERAPVLRDGVAQTILERGKDDRHPAPNHGSELRIRT